MWEVAERRTPYETNSDFPEFMVPGIARILEGVRPQEGEGCEMMGDGFTTLMRRCWSAAPLQRPTFEGVVEELGAILKMGGGVDLAVEFSDGDGLLMR
jgi:hypothetical protein